MDIQSIKSITAAEIGKEIIVSGQISKISKTKKTTFFVLQDGMLSKSKIQCVCDSVLAKDLEKESYLKLICLVSKPPSKHHTDTGLELQIIKILHVSMSDTDFSERMPDDAGPYVQLKERHLYLRKQQMCLYTKLTALVVEALRKTMKCFDGTEVFPPSFGSIKCEGGSEIFEFDHFGTTCYLSQSAQLYLETFVSRGTVYCLDKSYRAEKSLTRRHLSCYQHFEVEKPSFDSFEDFLTFLETFLVKFFEILLKKDDGTLEELKRKEFIKKYLEKGFLRLSHKKAIEMLRERGIKKKDGSEYEPLDDIPEAPEREIIKEIDQIVLLTGFPRVTKAFYTATDLEDPFRAYAVDIEFPGVGEIFGCSLRESDYKTIREKLKFFTLRDISEEFVTLLEIYKEDKKIKSIKESISSLSSDILESILLETIEFLKVQEPIPDTIPIDFIVLTKKIKEIPYEAYDWYFDLRKYGSPLSGGFGIGIERLVAWISSGGEATIKDVTSFPRFMGCTSP